METNEQKLTKEEKLMFFILGLILTVAVGVLIIDGFSKKDKSLDSETPTSEVETGDEEQSQQEFNRDLIEAPSEENESSDSSSEKQQKSENENSDSEKENNQSKEENKKDESKASEQEKNNGKKKLPYTAADGEEDDTSTSPWKVNREIVTEAYTGTKIKINKNVILEKGVMEEAVVTVRRLIGNRLVIIDTKNNEFIAEEGTYVYSYTKNNVTKEITLKVYNNLEPEEVDTLSLKETEEKKSIVSNESFNYILQNNLNTVVSLEEDVYNITSVYNHKSNEVIIKVRLAGYADRITSKTQGVKVLEPGKYHEELQPNEIILLLNLDILSKEDTNIITLNIDGKNYIFKVNVNLVNTRKELKDKKGSTTKELIEDKIIVKEPPTVPEYEAHNQKPHVEFLLNVKETEDVNNNSLEEFP
jgi:hypothetical protein